MSTITTTRPTRRRRRTPQWLRIAEWHFMGHLVVWAGFLAVWLALAVIVLFAVSRRVEPSLSALQFAPHIAIWVPFGVSIYFVNDWLTVHLAAGMTRRLFVRAGLSAGMAIAVVAAVSVTWLLLLETWIYGRLGWRSQAIPEKVLPSEAGFWPYTWGMVMLTAAGAVCGLLVGLTYLRLGPGGGTLCLPLTVLPLFVVATLGVDPRRMFTPWDLTFYGGGAGQLLGVAAIVCAAVAVHLLARDVPAKQ